MKRLTLFAVLVLCASMAFSQAKIFTAKNGRTGAAISNKAYTASTYDTTQAVYPRLFKETILLLWMHDSASVGVYAFPSYDGVTYATNPVFIDSLSGDADSSSATVIGNVLPFAIHENLKGVYSFKFQIDVQPFRLGVTTPRYEAKIVQIP